MSAETRSVYVEDEYDHGSTLKDLNLSRPEWNGLEMGPRAHMQRERERACDAARDAAAECAICFLEGGQHESWCQHHE